MRILKKVIKQLYHLRMKLSKRTGLGISIKPNSDEIKAPVSFYSLEATTNNGQELSLEKFSNKKTLIVNLASKCGFTPQYEELEKLYRAYKDKINILGFPSDDFGGQEPGSDKEIADFCKINFGVTFPLFHKDHVKGDYKQPVYQWLSSAAINGWNNDEPAWNFFKYLIDERGNLINIFSSSVSPLSEELLDEIRT